MTSFHLKIIAIVTMLIDHMGVVFFPGQSIPYRLIGRTAFPLFAFMIAEGFAHTRNMPKYFARLAAFAVISQIPFSLMNNSGMGSWLNLRSLNIYFTLALGLLAIALYELIRKAPFLQKLPQLLRRALGLIPAFALAWLANYIHTDYGWKGVLLIVAFHVSVKRWQTVLCVLGLMMVYLYPYLMSGRMSWTPLGLLLAIPPLYFYNGEPGPKMPRYLFYAIYPAHILLFVAIKRIMFLLM